MLAITVALLPATLALFLAAGLGATKDEIAKSEKKRGFLFAYGLLIVALAFARYA